MPGADQSGQRQHLQNPRQVDRVALVRCTAFDYEIEAVRLGVRHAIDLVGGIGAYCKPGEKVLLKVNLLARRAPEKAVTSHPAIVQSLAELLVAHGCEVIIGDSPGGPLSEGVLRGVYATCGMDAVARATDAQLNFDMGSSTVDNPSGLLVKHVTNLDVLRHVDKVISVARLKTHVLMTLTAATKNLFGTIPGTLKAEYHLMHPGYDGFADSLIDICIAANPVLSLVDGIVAMEGAGPANGAPRDVGVLVASASPYAADLVCTDIVGLAPDRVPTVRRSVDRGLVPDDVCKLDMVGDPIDSLRVPDFAVWRVVKSGMFDIAHIPRPLRRSLDRMLQPSPTFVRQLCIGCGVCARNCPSDAITMSFVPPGPERDPTPTVRAYPEVDPDRCIRCLCCQELCPNDAVRIVRPPLARFLDRL